jgi:hypothetical protein
MQYQVNAYRIYGGQITELSGQSARGAAYCLLTVPISSLVAPPNGASTRAS